MVQSSWASAPVKRAILQAYKIVEELIGIIGKPPAKVFLETTREALPKAKKQRTTSRYQQLKELYAKLRQENQEVAEQLAAYEGDQQALNSKSLYLYFTQLGRCAYCGQPIDISRINDSKLYDIDHIIPRSYLKDDSLHNNLVLVHAAENRKKTNDYPLRPEYQQQALWRQWHAENLISKAKLDRLCRTEALTEADKEGFIARQLVETAQAVKLVRDLLQAFLPQTKVVLTRAGVASDFRREMAVFERDEDDNAARGDDGKPIVQKMLKPEYVKCRELNDFHHAKDAYLTIVCGNVLHAKFTENPRAWFAKRNDLGREENNLSKLFWHEQREFGTGKPVWDIEERLQTVNHHMRR